MIFFNEPEKKDIKKIWNKILNNFNKLKRWTESGSSGYLFKMISEGVAGNTPNR